LTADATIITSLDPVGDEYALSKKDGGIVSADVGIMQHNLKILTGNYI